MDALLSAAATLKQARVGAGLTQRELAELAATSQSAVAAYEAGAREPTLPVLDRMIRAAGHVLALTVEPDPRIYRLADLASDLRAADDTTARSPTALLDTTARSPTALLDTTARSPTALLDTAARSPTALLDEARRLRLVFEFLRGADEDGHPVRLLVAVEPDTTGDRRFDALLAAIAEDRCIRAGIAPPAWVHDDARFLDGMWWVSDLPSARARALVHTPASYRRRGVMLDRHDLRAA